MEVQTLYRRPWSKPLPPKETKKVKWLSEEALQITEKKREREREREVKGKGEKEIDTHLNAEFQGIAKKDFKKPS